MDHYYNNVFKRSHESISGGNMLDNEVDQKLRKLALDLARERQSSNMMLGNDMQLHGIPQPAAPQMPISDYQRLMSNMNHGFGDSSRGSVSSLNVTPLMDMQKTYLMMMQQQQAQLCADSSHFSAAAMMNRPGNANVAASSGNICQEPNGKTDNADRGDCITSGSTSAHRQQSAAEKLSSSTADQARRDTFDQKLLDTQMKILKQQEIFFERVVELVSMTTTLVHGVVTKYGLNPMEQPSPDQSHNMIMNHYMTNNAAKPFNTQQHPASGASKNFLPTLMNPASMSSGKVPNNSSFGSVPNAAPYFNNVVPLPTSSGFTNPFADPRRPRSARFVSQPVRHSLVPPFNGPVSVPAEGTVVGSLVTPDIPKSQMNAGNTVKAISLSPNATSSPSRSSPGLEIFTSAPSEIVSVLVGPPIVMISPDNIKKET